jgi:hypothetical protein
VGHTSDIYLLFNNKHLNATDKVVARYVNDYWQNFVTTLNPSAAARESTAAWESTAAREAQESSTVPWPAYAPGNATQLLGLNNTGHVSGLHSARCDFWASLHPVPYQ